MSNISIWNYGHASSHLVYGSFTRGKLFRGRQVILQGYFTQKYFSHLGHMKALHLLFHLGYGS